MYKFDFELDDFQKEAVELINKGKSVVVCAPTGAGKTCIAEHAVHLALEKGEKVFYTTPLKALSNQKYRDFSNKYGSENVGLLTGDTSINRDAPVVVMTTEVFRNMLYGTNFGKLSENLKNVKYVVLDEVHYMNDEQRGTVWEESIIYCPTDICIIALSATVANVHRLCEWINTVHPGTECVYTDFRPVPLRFFYSDPAKPREILPLLSPGGKLNSKIARRGNSGNFRRKNRQSNVTDIVLTLNDKKMLPAIYFTFSRKKCNEQAEKCAHLGLLSKEEKNRASKIIEDFVAENPFLYGNKHLENLYGGVAAHHAGLLPGLKVLTERLFQQGLIKVVFSTETLAAGINMPAKTTVISSVSKRCDTGNRMLTANEFLQMSGRAGRRGMDDIGYVVVVGSQFVTPDEIADLVLSDANPLESRFAPGYSMVLNLLQKFSVEEAEELILKSFGYFSSNERLEPLLRLQKHYEETIERLNSAKCPFDLQNKDMLDYAKTKDRYVEMRKVSKMLLKQARTPEEKKAPELVEFLNNTKSMLNKMKSYPCDTCKLYKQHGKDLKVVQRLEKKARENQKTINIQKDIYRQKFLNHKKILDSLGYMKDDYPTEKGLLCSKIRAENELYVSEIILSGILDELSPAELSAVICTILTEEVRVEKGFYLSVSKGVKKALGEIKRLKRNLIAVQKNYGIETDMHFNSFYAPLVEMWANGSTWEELNDLQICDEGDLVRTIKRTVDLLKQIHLLPDINPVLKENAKIAVDLILKEPVDAD